MPFRIEWMEIVRRCCRNERSRRSGLQASPTPKGRHLASRTAATTLMLFLRTAAHRLGGNLESKLPATEDGGHYKGYRYFTVYRSFRQK